MEMALQLNNKAIARHQKDRNNLYKYENDYVGQ